MAGHSKWHNIQHRKGAQDAKRGKIFTKLIKEIVVATKKGGDIVENNPTLRVVIDKALAANMKRDTINKAIQRGSSNLAADNYEEIRYEGYGISGTAIMLDCLTDNKNRTVAEVRHTFSKNGGKLGTNGSVSYIFKKQAFINFVGKTEEELTEIAIDLGVNDIITNEDGSIDIITNPEDIFFVKDTLDKKGLQATNYQITMQPLNTVNLNLEDAIKFIKIIDTLNSLEDVQDIYHNGQISQEIMQKL